MAVLCTMELTCCACVPMVAMHAQRSASCALLRARVYLSSLRCSLLSCSERRRGGRASSAAHCTFTGFEFSSRYPESRSRYRARRRFCEPAAASYS